MNVLDLLCGEMAGEFDLSLETAKELCKKFNLVDNLMELYGEKFNKLGMEIFHYYRCEKRDDGNFDVWGVNAYDDWRSVDEYRLGCFKTIDNIEEELNKINYYFIYGEEN